MREKEAVVLISGQKNEAYLIYYRDKQGYVWTVAQSDTGGTDLYLTSIGGSWNKSPAYTTDGGATMLVVFVAP